jgi:hypothetical protein
MAKLKKQGLTKKHRRKLRDHDGVVHVVRMKAQSVPVPFRFPRGSTLCGELSVTVLGLIRGRQRPASVVWCPDGSGNVVPSSEGAEGDVETSA